jgi:carboxypeptidase C (cathepsin A)
MHSAPARLVQPIERRKPVKASLLLLLLAFAPTLHADDTPTPQNTLPQPDATTTGTVTVGGQRINYTAVVGTITVGATNAQDAMLGLDGKLLPGSEEKEPKNPEDAPATARISYVAYFKTGEAPEHRPVTFFYNGGPGSSTVWLHMGSFGPRRVVVTQDEHNPAAPYHLVENTESLLDTSDVVFIDAPGTGFGRLFGKDKEKAFWGVDQDAHAFARFICRFLVKYNRWNSPKYLFGESYGTTRSADLINILENDRNVDFNGVILLSQILNFATDVDGARENPGVDLGFELGLPTYAATAWYHHKLPSQPAALEPFLTEVEAFATGDYARALAQGNTVSASEKAAVAEKLHTYTGLPASYWVKADLRVQGGAFEKELQDEQGITTGRLDTRYSGPTLDRINGTAEYDPQSAAISSAYVSSFNDYVRRELHYGQAQTFSPDVYAADSFKWDWRRMGHESDPTEVNVMGDLATAMKTNPRLKVMLNGGYYDLATPFYAAVYEEHHLPIPASLTGNIEYHFYESGHMIYIHEESLRKLHANVSAFIRSTENTH